MAIISIELWCTSVSKVGRFWIVQSDSVLVTLDIDDSNNDGLIDGDEWDAFTSSGGGGLDQGSPMALYDGSPGNNGFLYSAIEYSTGDDVTSVIRSLGNNFEADPDDLGDVVCFCKGTMIRADTGEIPIENLTVGDLVETLDHGFQPIRWIGRQTVTGTGRLAPIRFAAHALDNKRELLLSPQHRILLSGWRAELMFGSPEVLVSAKSLINETTIRPVERDVVEYYHILFDTHELIFAEGALAESLFLSSRSIEVLGQEAQDEIFDLFPVLSEFGFDTQPSAARLALRYFEARAMTAA